MRKYLKEGTGNWSSGDVVYLLSSKWWNLWKEAINFVVAEDETQTTISGGDDDDDDLGKEEEGRGTALPAIDNEDLLESKKEEEVVEEEEGRRRKGTGGAWTGGRTERREVIRLRSDLMKEYDYVVLPQLAWQTLVSWYGGGPVVARRILTVDPAAAKTTTTTTRTALKESVVELYPMQSVKILREYKVLLSGSSQKVVSRLECTEVGFSYLSRKSTTVREFRKLICQHFHLAVDNNDKARLWNDIYEDDNDHLNHHRGAVSSRQQQHNNNNKRKKKMKRKPKLKDRVLLNPDHTLEEVNVVDGQTLFLELQRADGSWERRAPPSKPHTALIIDNKPPTPSPVTAVATTVSDTVVVLGEAGRGGSSTKGVVGLTNLGNTCFMNSAIQCLSNVSPLTSFFLANRHTLELNSTNPLGFRGEIAKRFALLIKLMWVDSNQQQQLPPLQDEEDKQKKDETRRKKGRINNNSHNNNRVVSPVELRRAVTRFIPMFNNDGQHDAQEFLAILLDGLHEGLNRIRNKPYLPFEVEPDLGDEELAQMAWNYYRLRNQSVIVDLFHGQIKSSLVCQECAFSSVTFDPFTFLSLPLPHETMRVILVLVLFADKTRPSVKYGIRIHKEARVHELKDEIARLCAIPKTRLQLADVVGHHIFRIINNDSSLQTIRERDSLLAYEVSQSPPSYAPTLATTTLLAQHGQQQTKKNQALGLLDVKEPGIAKATTTKILHAVINQQQQPQRSVIHIPAVNRIVEKQEEVFFLKPFKAITFGDPLIVSFIPEINTNHQLYSFVWNALQRFLNPTTAVKATTREGKGGGEGEGVRFYGTNGCYPYTLRVVTSNGMACGICSWNRFCVGCEIPCDNQLSSALLKRLAGAGGNSARLYKPGLSIAIDWSYDAMKLLYSHEKGKVRRKKRKKILPPQPYFFFPLPRHFIFRIRLTRCTKNTISRSTSLTA
jgi:hypothetical protein